MSGASIRTEQREGDVLAIVMDRPAARVNLIDDEWLAGISAALDRAERERPRGIVIVSAKPGSFLAGADVSLIAGLETAAEAARRAREGQTILSRLEDLPCPTIAVVNGTCLGGGLELALACTAIFAADDDQVSLGLPEVRLGILPGFGGTWRLPRRVGLLAALPWLLSGKNLRAQQAVRLGLVDRLAAPEILERVAREAAGGRVVRRRLPIATALANALVGRTALGRQALRAATERRLRSETGGHYPAPTAILNCAIHGYGAPRERAGDHDAAAFGELAVTTVAKNLLFLFRGDEQLARWPWTGAASATDTSTHRTGIVGAGTMGGAIAGLFAERGIDVRLRDVALESLRVGLVHAAAPLHRRVARRVLAPRERDKILARISPTTGNAGFSDADWIVEAVPEKLELKQRIFAELEQLASANCVLASNTSSLPISSIAATLKRPERVIGLHFFNPVNRMPLVEIIPAAATSARTVDRAVGFVRRLKKTPIVVADRPGFLVNRLLLPYLNEAARCAQEGWSPERIDGALTRFGFPMGPLTVLDEVGLDVAGKVAHVLHEAFGERAQPAEILERLVARGAFGAKTGRGFWTRDGRRRSANDADLGERPSAPEISDDAITFRLLGGMINEAALCLEERVVAHPDHIDMASVLGFGFPPFRGGLLRWARSVGEPAVRERLRALATFHGARFTPVDSLPHLFREWRIS